MGERLADSVAPVRAAVSAVLDALLTTASDALAKPVEVGANLTVTVQVPVLALKVVQLFDWVNSAPSVPGTSVTLVTLTDEAVPLVTVNACVELEPTAAVRVAEVGERLTEPLAVVVKKSDMGAAVAAAPRPEKLAPRPCAIVRSVFSCA